MKKRALLIGVLVVGLSGVALARFIMLPKEVVEGTSSEGPRMVYGPWMVLPETVTTLAPGEKVEMKLEMDASIPAYKYRGVVLKEMLPLGDIERNPDRGRETLVGGGSYTSTPENKTSKPQTYQIRVRRFWHEVRVTRYETYWNGRKEETRFTRKQAVTSPWIDFQIDFQRNPDGVVARDR